LEEKVFSSLNQEKKVLEGFVSGIKKRERVFLVAEHKDKIIGTSTVHLKRGREDHIGELGITIAEGYRGIGLGRCLFEDVIDLATKKLKPKPRIIALMVYENNKPAIALYEKCGFKKVSQIPDAVQWKEALISECRMYKYL